ncbi:hypothetical protein [Blastopirellula marina]|uniref:Carboxypeptidase regulatory-like domain-containing protein n=1 Tax=Blastopirellula marina TaxID=124 RepID=A0A2S8GFM8_9BACT|nr:hypothetical protein [Blastopirellula marina]PQO43071.1 hypothetical protein C5Y93_25510 [Blastopirellula marina]
MKMFAKTRTALLSALSLALLGWTLGCSSKEEWHTDLVPAVGSVTVNGEIPVGAIINLHPVKGPVDKRASRPSALVAEDGTYTLTTYEYGDGAPPGDYSFTILWPQDPKMGGLSPDRLGRVYATPTVSKLVVTIPSDGSPIEPVAIDKAKITMNSPRKSAQPGPGPGPG